MKLLQFILLFCIILFTGCFKEPIHHDGIIGKWQLEKIIKFEGDITVAAKDQRIKEFTIDKKCITYDYKGVEISRYSYNVDLENLELTIYETNDPIRGMISKNGDALYITCYEMGCWGYSPYKEYYKYIE